MITCACLDVTRRNAILSTFQSAIPPPSASLVSQLPAAARSVSMVLSRPENPDWDISFPFSQLRGEKEIAATSASSWSRSKPLGALPVPANHAGVIGTQSSSQYLATQAGVISWVVPQVIAVSRALLKSPNSALVSR